MKNGESSQQTFIGIYILKEFKQSFGKKIGPTIRRRFSRSHLFSRRIPFVNDFNGPHRYRLAALKTILQPIDSLYSENMFYNQFI